MVIRGLHWLLLYVHYITKYYDLLPQKPKIPNSAKFLEFQIPKATIVYSLYWFKVNIECYISIRSGFIRVIYNDGKVNC